MIRMERRELSQFGIPSGTEGFGSTGGDSRLRGNDETGGLIALKFQVFFWGVRIVRFMKIDSTPPLKGDKLSLLNRSPY